MKRPHGIVAALLLTIWTAVAAQEGPLEGSYYEGYFDDGKADNDWFFDRYGVPLADRSDSGRWYYGDALFSGHYDGAIGDDDWFFDSYGDPGDDGLFDV